MDRRKFLYSLGTGALSIASLSAFTSNNELEKLTILHTNDTHSHIDPFPVNHKKYPNKGGVNRRKALVDKIKQQEKMFCY
jgi:5'-nucleotidase